MGSVVSVVSHVMSFQVTDPSFVPVQTNPERNRREVTWMPDKRGDGKDVVEGEEMTPPSLKCILYENDRERDERNEETASHAGKHAFQRLPRLPRWVHVRKCEPL